MEHEIIMQENIQKSAKWAAITHAYPRAKIARLNDTFLEVFEWEVSPVEGQSLQQKDEKRWKREAKKTKHEKKQKAPSQKQVTSQNFDF